MGDDVRKARIGRAEGALDRGRAALDRFSEELAKFEAAQGDVSEVADYLGSEEWFDDRDAEAAGELEAGVRAGILTEDLGYDLLVDNRELAIRMLELATRILREL